MLQNATDLEMAEISSLGGKMAALESRLYGIVPLRSLHFTDPILPKFYPPNLQEFPTLKLATLLFVGVL